MTCTRTLTLTSTHDAAWGIQVLAMDEESMNPHPTPKGNGGRKSRAVASPQEHSWVPKKYSNENTSRATGWALANGYNG